MTSSNKVFFGSGPVAAKSLELLIKHTDIEAVITKPRPPHHKGAVPVIDVAKNNNIPIFTASNKAELDELIGSHEFASKHAILIDFGIIVSQKVIDKFPLGIINSHFSLLPKLRGADPITWSIANGDSKTGVSLMIVDRGMDTGKLIAQRSINISADDNSQSLTQKLITLSDQLLTEKLPGYLSGEIKPRNQPHPDRATYSRKLSKSDGAIDWSLPAREIEARIRAFSEWPQSRTRINDIEVIITSAKISDVKSPDSSKKPGDFWVDQKRLFFSTSDGAIEILLLKPLGKKEMPVKAFLAGYSNRI